MAFTILYIRDKGFRNLRIRNCGGAYFNNFLDDSDIRALVVASNVINLTQYAIAQHHINCFAMILNIQPITHIQTIAIYR